MGIVNRINSQILGVKGFKSIILKLKLHFATFTCVTPLETHRICIYTFFVVSKTYIWMAIFLSRLVAHQRLKTARDIKLETEISRAHLRRHASFVVHHASNT